MKLLTFAAFTSLGYAIVMKLAPIVQAKIEAMDIDDMWDVFDHE